MELRLGREGPDAQGLAIHLFEGAMAVGRLGGGGRGR